MSGRPTPRKDIVVVNTPSHPHSPPPSSQPAKPAPKPAVDSEEPQKYKRPLPQPGDKDYVTGQPIDDEEADKVEKQEADKHAAAKQEADKHAAAKAAAAKKEP
jgi:hypothetical protein